MAVVAQRWSWPTSRGSPAGSVSIRTMPASRAGRRAVSGPMGPAKARSPPVTPGAPRAAQRANRSMTTRIWAAAPRTVGRSPARRARRGEFDRGVVLAVAVGAGVPGRPVAVEQGLEGGVQVFAADRVEVAGEVDAAAGGDGHPEQPGLAGGVVEGAVGVDAGDPAADGEGGVLGAQRHRGRGQDLVGGGRVDAVGLGGGQPGRGERGGDHLDVGGGDLSGDPAVPGQPALHRDHAVGALGVAAVGGGDEPGLRRGQLVERALERRDAVEQLAVGELGGIEDGQVESGELVEQGAHLRHG
jgi:hypothetical protein